MSTNNAATDASIAPVRHRARPMPATQPMATSAPATTAAMDFHHLGGQNLAIERHDPQRLVPNARNPRTHSAQQIQQLADWIHVFGFMVPLLVDGEGRMVAGHGRFPPPGAWEWTGADDRDRAPDPGAERASRSRTTAWRSWRGGTGSC